MQRPVPEQRRRMRVGVHVGDVGDVVSALLEERDQERLEVGEATVAGVAVLRGVRPVEAHLDRRPAVRISVRDRAVEVIQAAPGERMRAVVPADTGRRVVREVVVRLIGVHRRHVDDPGRTAVADGEHDLGLIVGSRRRQDGEVDAGRPRVRDAKPHRRVPRARDHAGRPNRVAGRLRRARERAEVRHQPAALAVVVAQAVDVDRVRLVPRGRDAKADRAALQHAGGGRVALDVEPAVVGDPISRPGDVPAVRAGVAVLGDDRIGVAGRKCGSRRRSPPRQSRSQPRL